MATKNGDGSIILKTKVDETGVKKGISSIKKIASAAGKSMTFIAAAAATATVAITKQAVSAYADYEQLVGGVETLFKDSADKVIEYAHQAFYTTGMSANEYMQNVTSFSASLLNSLGGDTEKAADVANAALISISDNVNKMGSEQESVLMAFQGFAKGQYQLLDNLKLGYGGTKTEMQRLLKDAQAITGVKYNIDNLADVYTAIGVIQEKLGIAGTTAKEAATTITGSATMTKAAWQNVLTAISGGGDLDVAIENLVFSVEKYFDNLVPVIERSLSGIGDMIAAIAPKLIETIGRSIIQAMPMLMAAIYEMIIGLAKGVAEGIKALFTGTAKEAIAPQIKAIDSAADSQNSLTDAVEETANAQKKSLAGFDTLQTMASNSADAAGDNTAAMPQTAGVSVGDVGSYDTGITDSITAELAKIMEIAGTSMIAIGLILLFTGNIAWGIGAIIFGLVSIGCAIASVKGTDMAADVIGVLTTIMGIVGGALVAIGIILIMLGSTAIGVSLIVAGAVSLIGSVAALVGFDVATIQNVLTLITGIASGAMLAIGIMLCVFAGPTPLSIGLIVGGALALAATIALNTNAVIEAIQGPIGLIMAIAGAALLAIGIILVCTGAALPLGIGLIVAGAISLAATIAINSEAIVEAIRGPIGVLMGIVGGALLVIGIILCCCGVFIPGIPLIVAGAAALGTTIALNWNAIVDKVKAIGKAIANVFVNVWNSIKSGWQKLVSTVTDIGKKIGGAVGGAFKSAVNWILEKAISIINGFIKMINGAISVINAIPGVNISKIKSLEVPKLAKGAVIPPNREFLAILGDQKSGVNIEAPLDTIVDAFKAVQGGQKIEVNFTGSLAQLARILAPEITTENNRASVFAKG